VAALIPAHSDRRVILGEIVGAFGVTGWVKVRSYTEPPDGLLGYDRVQVGREADWRELEIEAGAAGGRGLRLKLATIDDRNAAAGVVGARIAVLRSQLPALGSGEFYLSDLEGLEVVSIAGEVLGTLDHFIETPAHPVMVIRGAAEHLVPLVGERLISVDLAAGRLVVDWRGDW
jgi:16S rRNA processing protein RimM